MVRVLVLCFLMSFVLSCKNGSGKKTSMMLEIFSTKGDAKTMEKGELQYFESSEYEGNKKISTTYYDAKGNVKGKEVFEFLSPADSLPIAAKYIDGRDQTLSYYKYINDDKGKAISSFAFDASNDELLRVEQYSYKNNLLHSKRIFDGNMNANRRYVFSYDEKKNETGFIVYNAKDSLMVNEEFKITKVDENNKWVEKWGFANGKPVTFHKRTSNKVK